MFVSKYSYGYNQYSNPLGLIKFSGRILSSPPQRGDLVVFKYPRDNKTDYVKRVIGLPGDVVQMRNGRLFINGELIEREKVGAYVYAGANGERAQSVEFKETLSNGKTYSILEDGDDRRLDNTGEFHVPRGQYFVLGDNRDHSADSRADVGYVPEENIFGKFGLVVWNGNDYRFELRHVH